MKTIDNYLEEVDVSHLTPKEQMAAKFFNAAMTSDNDKKSGRRQAEERLRQSVASKRKDREIAKEISDTLNQFDMQLTKGLDVLDKTTSNAKKSWSHPTPTLTPTSKSNFDRNLAYGAIALAAVAASPLIYKAIKYLYKSAKPN